MTREQDLERQLADWLVAGPSAAPAEVVDHALKQTESRRQWRGARRPLLLPLARLGRWFPAYRTARVSALAVVLAGILLTSLIVSVPFLGGGTGPPPEMDGAPRVVTGTAQVDVLSETPAELVRSVDFETGERSIDGRARQELTVLVRTGDAHQSHGTMRLENDWGVWEGAVDIIRYPSGEEYEYASLSGRGDAYEGYTYLYVIRQATAEAERTVEGAIWPGEPPPPLDPSVLP